MFRAWLPDLWAAWCTLLHPQKVHFAADVHFVSICVEREEVEGGEDEEGEGGGGGEKEEERGMRKKKKKKKPI